MKKSFAFFFAFLLVLLSSCSLVNDIIPDIDTDFTQETLIQFHSSTGESEEKLIDVSLSSDYNNFKSNIEKFEIRKITYKIINVNTPDDMYFNGEVICSNEEKTEILSIGTITGGNLIALEADGEKTVDMTPENIEKVLLWMNTPGRFKLKSGYSLTTPEGTAYPITGYVSNNFVLVIKFYVTVITKV
jgi:hypothetical protein